MVETYFAPLLVPLESEWTTQAGGEEYRTYESREAMRREYENAPKIEVRRFKIKCGAPCGCHGILGYMTEAIHTPHYATGRSFFDNAGWALVVNGGEVQMDWCVHHELHYWRDGDGAFHIIRSKRAIPSRSSFDDAPHRVGRRPFPNETFASAASKEAGNRGIVGQYPILPAIIYCPECEKARRHGAQLVTPPP